jgi:hypothetical protein
MCGIVGVFSFRDRGFRVTERYLTPMRDAIGSSTSSAHTLNSNFGNFATGQIFSIGPR